MSQFLLQLRTDCRRFRWWWLALAVGALVNACLQIHIYRHGDLLASPPYLTLLAGAGLVAVLLIMGDPPHSTSAFWRTRPWRRGWFGAAKFAASALVVMTSVPLTQAGSALLSGAGVGFAAKEFLIVAMAAAGILWFAWVGGFFGAITGSLVGFIAAVGIGRNFLYPRWFITGFPEHYGDPAKAQIANAARTRVTEWATEPVAWISLIGLALLLTVTVAHFRRPHRPRTALAGLLAAMFLLWVSPRVTRLCQRDVTDSMARIQGEIVNVAVPRGWGSMDSGHLTVYVEPPGDPGEDQDRWVHCHSGAAQVRMDQGTQPFYFHTMAPPSRWLRPPFGLEEPRNPRPYIACTASLAPGGQILGEPKSISGSARLMFWDFTWVEVHRFSPKGTGLVSKGGVSCRVRLANGRDLDLECSACSPTAWQANLPWKRLDAAVGVWHKDGHWVRSPGDDWRLHFGEFDPSRMEVVLYKKVPGPPSLILVEPRDFAIEPR